jgi:signal transduction histidine kinase
MKGGGRLRLSVCEVQDTTGPGEVVIAVQDEGCGIPADEIESIFQPFRSTFERGTGLGLATVHRIVTDYNGTIQVQSAVGSGTTMRVRLPAQHEVAEAAARRPAVMRSAIA